jgi:hypothetical protein
MNVKWAEPKFKLQRVQTSNIGWNEFYRILHPIIKRETCYNENYANIT